MKGMTYRKLLTIKPLMSRFVQFWRFAGGGGGNRNRGGLMRILIADDADPERAVIENAIQKRDLQIRRAGEAFGFHDADEGTQDIDGNAAHEGRPEPKLVFAHPLYIDSLPP